MTPEIIAVSISGLFLLVAVGLLLIGGRLVRHDRSRNAVRDGVRRSHSPLLEHLRPLQNLTVDFFARTEPSARLLGVLAAREHPLNLHRAGVHRRMTNPPPPRSNADRRRASVYDSLFVPVLADTDARPHKLRVREALDQIPA